MELSRSNLEIKFLNLQNLLMQIRIFRADQNYESLLSWKSNNLRPSTTVISLALCSVTIILQHVLLQCVTLLYFSVLLFTYFIQAKRIGLLIEVPTLEVPALSYQSAHVCARALRVRCATTPQNHGKAWPALYLVCCAISEP